MTDPNVNALTNPRDYDPRSAYLDPAVKIEPLVDRWYAWPHLLSAAQQALNLQYRYLPAIRSFIAAPMVHVAASQTPEMFGGPFVDLPATAVDAAQAYVDACVSDRAEALEFASAYRDFDVALQSANGYSLNEFRKTMPEALKGRVELVYDLNSHPKVRLLEEMFAESDLGLSGACEILLHRQPDVDRPFFLSTPRLNIDGGAFIRTPFGASGVATLCSARSNPVDLDRLATQLGVSRDLLAPYFVATPPDLAENYAGEGVRVRYFGHACLLIETNAVSILVDPTAARDRLPGVTHFTFDDFPPRIDYLLVSHGHQDHFTPEVLLQLRDRVGAVLIPPNNRGELADPSLRRMLEALGYSSVRTLEPLSPLEIPDGALTALPFSGEHSDLDVHAKQCAVVELKGRRICLFVDSDAIDLEVYKRISDRLMAPDLMFLGMECFGAPLSWLYGPLISGPLSKKNDNSRRLSGADSFAAQRLTDILKPRRAYVYAMGQEPWMRGLMGLQYSEESVQLREAAAYVAYCRQAGVPAELLNQHLELTL